MTDERKLVNGLLFLALALATGLCILSQTGCATGLAQAEKALPGVAEGTHLAAQSGHDILLPICRSRAQACQSRKVGKGDCPGYLKCDSVRTALEAVTQGIEDDLIGLKSKIEAFRKVQKAIEALK